MNEKLTRTSSCPQAWAWWESGAPRVAVLGYFRAYFKDGTWWNVFFPEDMDVRTPELVKEFETVYSETKGKTARFRWPGGVVYFLF